MALWGKVERQGSRPGGLVGACGASSLADATPVHGLRAGSARHRHAEHTDSTAIDYVLVDERWWYGIEQKMSLHGRSQIIYCDAWYTRTRVGEKNIHSM